MSEWKEEGSSRWFEMRAVIVSTVLLAGTRRAMPQWLAMPAREETSVASGPQSAMCAVQDNFAE